MPHYYDEEQQGPLRPTKIQFYVLEKTFNATTASGTFSRTELDKATKLLIEHASTEISERNAMSETQNTEEQLTVLDLGCGWGAVGIALKSVHQDINLTMVDVNKRAIMLAKQNMLSAHVEANVQVSNIFSKINDDAYDLILTNPPYAAGREICYDFITQSYEHLEQNGVFLLVARHQKGGAMLEKKIKETFGNVKTIAKKGGFRIYKGTKE